MTDRETIDVLFNKWKCIDRNDGIHCDRKCESCDLVMDVQTIREAFNMAISALQAQEAKAQLFAEGTTSDLISRQDAIKVIEEMQMPIMRSMFPEEQFVFKGMSEALSAIKDLPSAQPTLYGYNMEHLKLIAEVLRKENLSPERVAEALTDVGRIVSIVRAEFEEELRKAVERCVI